jgi:hypothetical protein
MFIYRRVVNGPAGAQFVDNTGIEEWLLEHAPPAEMDDDLKRYAAGGLKRMPQTAQPKPTLPVSALYNAPDAPSWEPQSWPFVGNDVANYYNCYNYINNYRGCFIALPGRGGGAPNETMTCSAVVKAANADYLEPIAMGDIERINLSSGQGWFVAFTVLQGMRPDFHCYRLDNSGYWSHKRGRQNAINTDGDEELILYDQLPQSNLWGYQFCGFMIRPQQVRIA